MKVQFPGDLYYDSFISYSTILTKNSLEQRIILGSTDPSGNTWFHVNFLQLGVPYGIAKQIAKNIDVFFFKGK
ncbi:hypothetical protein [Candidatus Lokiarchaeum ossiferum]